MIDYLQQRIKPKEFGILIALFFIGVFGAYYYSANVIGADFQKMEKRILNLSKQRQFEEQQKSNYIDIDDPRQLKADIERIKAELEVAGVDLSTPDGRPKKRKVTNGAEAELRATTIVALVEQTGLSVLKVDATSSTDPTRTLSLTGTFGQLMTALKGMQKMDVGIIDLQIDRPDDISPLNIGLEIAL